MIFTRANCQLTTQNWAASGATEDLSSKVNYLRKKTLRRGSSEGPFPSYPGLFDATRDLFIRRLRVNATYLFPFYGVTIPDSGSDYAKISLSWKTWDPPYPKPDSLLTQYLDGVSIGDWVDVNLLLPRYPALDQSTSKNWGVWAEFSAGALPYFGVPTNLVGTSFNLWLEVELGYNFDPEFKVGQSQ